MIKIVSNLIDNAIKYCRSRIVLTLGSDPAGENAVVCITNDGDIVPEKERKAFSSLLQVGQYDDYGNRHQDCRWPNPLHCCIKAAWNTVYMKD